MIMCFGTINKMIKKNMYDFWIILGIVKILLVYKKSL